MTNFEQFDFDRSAYERPRQHNKCGRAAEWGKPCRHDPNEDGSCGGTAECTPYDNNGSWQCRRPQADGGRCENGPDPDGRCGCSRPPCVPRQTLRIKRWRLSVMAVGLVIALIATFTHLSKPHEIFAETFLIGALDSGPLTRNHTGFTGTQGCKTCHEAHDKKPMVWLMAAFGKNKMTKSCTECHTFGGPATSPHNAVFPKEKQVRKIECIMCHTEHKGEDSDISRISDEQCATCHEKPFSKFDHGHPKFSKQFPHFRRTSIRFDHARHFNKHFLDKGLAENVPKSCTTCHNSEQAERSIKPRGFEESCAGCHADQISKRPMVVLRLPEFVESSLDREAVAEVCAPPEEEEEDEEFESISADEMSEIAAYLMKVSGDDPGEYGEAFQELVMAMAEEGTAPLTGVIEDSGAEVTAKKLFAGLNTEAVKQMACAWAANLEYELPTDAIFGGWYGDLLELLYLPAGHGDPVVKNWLDLAVSVKAEDEAGKERVDNMREYLLSPKKGPGACIKCHAVTSDSDTGPAYIEWTYFKDAERSYLTYSHSEHLNLVNPQGVKLADPNQGCTTCHKLDLKADFVAGYADFNAKTFSSNFISMKKNLCVSCHTENRVRQDCRLCHRYHQQPGFHEQVTRNEN